MGDDTADADPEDNEDEDEALLVGSGEAEEIVDAGEDDDDDDDSVAATDADKRAKDTKSAFSPISTFSVRIMRWYACHRFNAVGR
jgi:hypothetical protein